jgi:hypothetical protein
MIDGLGQVDWLVTAGTWVALGISLLILSSILGDHWLARLGNHILVGAALGYAAVVTWHALIALPLATELVANPLTKGWNWIPIALAILLIAAALERILWQGESGPPRRGWRHVVRWLGMGPAALLVSAGMAVAALGVVQGTLGPQFLRTAQTGIDWRAPWGVFLTGLLAMVLTASTLIFFVVDPRHHLADQPGWVQKLMRGWIWVGQRAVWLAAGVVFARLVASRISLTFAEFESLGAMVETLWRTFVGS